VKLSVFDRLILLNILPKEGDFTTLKIMRKMKEDLSFSEEEHKALSFKTGDNGAVSWKTEGDTNKEINFGEKATDLIVETLKKLDKDKKLKEEHYSLFEKFVGG
jgi:hypothetical protein